LHPNVRKIDGASPDKSGRPKLSRLLRIVTSENARYFVMNAIRTLAGRGEMPKSTSLPLTDMKVLDLSRALAGPFCSAILGDLGADIIKVEPSPIGDMIRTWGPFDENESVYFLAANRNKRSIAIDFRSEHGQLLLRRLALSCDVLVENFKPGTMATIGLNPIELQSLKPDLIIGSISGFGSTGPLSARPGFDQIAQGYSGFMSFTGTPETGPTRVGVAIGDLTAGMWLAIGVLSAWVRRNAGGHGGLVQTSLFASLISLLSVQGQRYLSLGEVAQPMGNAHPLIAPYGVFSVSDGDINIGAATQGMWLKLCDVIGSPGLKSDPDFLNNAGRMKHRYKLHALIEDKLKSNTRSYWTQRFVDAGIPAGPINSIADALREPQVAHLGLVETHPHPTLGGLSQLSNPLALGSTKQSWIRRSPPLLGQHTRDILTEFGFSGDEIASFEAAGTVLQG
jgi:crotonobetainyl-CoA:carnitine CoA-transferase CaiB-like acyl-CoA transferase